MSEDSEYGSGVYERVVGELREKMNTLHTMEITPQTFTRFVGLLESMLLQSEATVLEKERLIKQREESIDKLIEKAQKSKQETLGNEWYGVSDELHKLRNELKDDLQWRNFQMEFLYPATKKLISVMKQISSLENEKFILEARIKLKELEEAKSGKENDYKLEMERIGMQREQIKAGVAQPPIAPKPSQPSPLPQGNDDGLGEDEEEEQSEDSVEEDDSPPEPKPKRGRQPEPLPEPDYSEDDEEEETPKKKPKKKVEEVAVVLPSAKNKGKKIKVSGKRGRKKKEIDTTEPIPVGPSRKAFILKKIGAGMAIGRIRTGYKIPTSQLMKYTAELESERKIRKVLTGRKPPFDKKWEVVGNVDSPAN